MGKCLACGIEREEKENFICASCGGKNKIVVVCPDCKTVTNLTRIKKEEFVCLETIIGHSLVRGMTIISTCPTCFKGKGAKKKISLKVVRIRKNGAANEETRAELFNPISL